MNTLYLTTTDTHLLCDEFGRSWEYVNAYFDPRVPCSWCECIDFAGWRCLETGEVRCNECVIVSRSQTVIKNGK